ncbi:DMT family transporter [Mucilaginibacter arboris]|uniref:EamA family transporter n=1 Tax=Mucilaginibacter arboris TaxID=2682090 RepID=A0A7K1SZG6_9SPHI|nr:DMT family transporter [Mucilaginibacter arboris]MVN22716.1 EamA family transporter [Mucilaginibacter arboris]
MDIAEGLLFALLWASATVATKFALHSCDLFLLTLIRFLTVSVLLLSYTYILKNKSSSFPSKAEFKKLFILGVLNVTVYMSGYLIAIKYVSAGLISLITAVNPLLLILFSAIFYKRKLTSAEITGVVIALSGLVLASVPNLYNSHATLQGLLALIAGIAALSAGSIYYANSGLTLKKMEVNTWQITIGGLLFIPIVLLNGANNFIIPDRHFFLSITWLIVPVSIVAYAMWLNLIQKDSVKAGLWLFLTPAFGYLMAVIVIHEKITVYGIAGSALVVGGLLYSRRKKTVVAAISTVE